MRFVDGPSNSPIARAALAKSNPAITIGNTVYFKPGEHSANFAATAGDENTLVHELTHVVQYKELEYAAFGAKYAADLARVRHAGQQSHAVYSPSPSCGRAFRF